MVEALLLDFLLGVAILLLIPLGTHRGGLREVCSSAGLLLGILLGQQWAVRWGNWIADTFDTSNIGSRFSVAVATAIMTTVIVGYGASSAFSYRPGPGGKMFGAALAAMNGVVLAGYLINCVAIYLNDGDYPEVIDGGRIGRILSTGFDWVLLVVAMMVVLMSLLGFVVREREPADQPWLEAQRTFTSGKSTARQATSTQPYMTPESEKIEPESDTIATDTINQETFTPIKIREVRHWEEQQPTRQQDTITGWQQTWPKSATGERIRPPWESAEEPERPAEIFRKVPPAHIPDPGDQTETLKRWIASETNDPKPKPGTSSEES